MIDCTDLPPFYHDTTHNAVELVMVIACPFVVSHSFCMLGCEQKDLWRQQTRVVGRPLQSSKCQATANATQMSSFESQRLTELDGGISYQRLGANLSVLPGKMEEDIGKTGGARTPCHYVLIKISGCVC